VSAIRKLFVFVGRFGFFRRNIIVFKHVGGKGGRGGGKSSSGSAGWAHFWQVEPERFREFWTPYIDCARFQELDCKLREEIALAVSQATGKRLTHAELTGKTEQRPF
jgi:hypothetical protein